MEGERTYDTDTHVEKSPVIRQVHMSTEKLKDIAQRYYLPLDVLLILYKYEIHS